MTRKHTEFHPKPLQQAVGTMWKSAVEFESLGNVTANGDGPAVEGKLKAVIEGYSDGQDAVLCPWGLLDSHRAGDR